MQRIIALWGWICFVLFIATAASAATYYVSPSGSDLNSGTALFPWKTIQMGANTASSGDTVLVQSGTYDEQVVVTKPGVTFRASGTVILPGMWNLTSADVYHPSRNSSGTVIDGFEMTGSSANSQMGCVFIGVAVTNPAIVNCRMHDTKVWGDLVGPIIMDSDNTGSNSCFGTVISNNVIYNFGGTAIAIKGFNGLITGNWISNSYGCDCFNIQGANHVVRSNFCTQIGLGICNLWGAGNNNFNGTYWYDVARSQSNGFSTWTNSNGYFLVQDSETWAARGWSNAFNIINSSYNHVYASADRMYDTWTMADAVMVSAPTNGNGSIEHPDWVESIGPFVNPSAPYWGLSATNILLENNMIINCPGGSPFMFGANWTNVPGPCCYWTFRNNVWAWCGVVGGVSDPYTKFYNNTFYQCCTNGNNHPLTLTFYSTNYSDPRGMAFYSEVKSNAFVGCGNIGGWYSASAAGSVSNAFFGLPSTGWYFNQTWTDSTPSDWPLFTVYTNSDYNYVDAGNGATVAQGTGYPSAHASEFSEPHGINGGHVFVDLTNGIYCFTNNGVIFGANLSYLYTNTPAPPNTNPPTISAQPANTTVASGATASFSVTAGGATPLAYQWRLNTAAIPGANSGSYSKSNITTNDAGSYTVVVTNAYGSITSSVAMLAVTASTAPTNSPSDTNLLLRLSFENITATDVPDVTMNGHDAWNMMGTNWITPTSGVFNGTAGFWRTNGTSTNGAQVYLISTYLAVTNVSGLTNMPAMTVSVWTKTDPIGNDSSIMCIVSSGYSVMYAGNPSACSNSWDLRRVTSPNMQFWLHAADDDHVLLDFPCDVISCPHGSDLTQTSWHHYAATVDCAANTIIGYHDGAPFQTNTLDVPYVTVYGGPNERWLCIGADAHNGVPQWGNWYSPNDGYFAGAMDELRIYNRALSASEVSGLYNGPAPNRPPAPTGLRIVGPP